MGVVDGSNDLQVYSQYDFSGGENLSSNPLAVKENQLAIAENVYVNNKGELVKAPGLSAFQFTPYLVSSRIMVAVTYVPSLSSAPVFFGEFRLWSDVATTFTPSICLVSDNQCFVLKDDYRIDGAPTRYGVLSVTAHNGIGYAALQSVVGGDDSSILLKIDLVTHAITSYTSTGSKYGFRQMVEHKGRLYAISEDYSVVFSDANDFASFPAENIILSNGPASNLNSTTDGLRITGSGWQSMLYGNSIADFRKDTVVNAVNGSFTDKAYYQSELITEGYFLAGGVLHTYKGLDIQPILANDMLSPMKTGSMVDDTYIMMGGEDNMLSSALPHAANTTAILFNVKNGAIFRLLNVMTQEETTGLQRIVNIINIPADGILISARVSEPFSDSTIKDVSKLFYYGGTSPYPGKIRTRKEFFGTFKYKEIKQIAVDAIGGACTVQYYKDDETTPTVLHFEAPLTGLTKFFINDECESISVEIIAKYHIVLNGIRYIYRVIPKVLK